MTEASTTPPLAGGTRLAELIAAESRLLADQHRRCRDLFATARRHLPGGVPMSWMAKWPGGFPLFVEEAVGAHFTCADGLEYVDFCLGDTGAMTGHAPPAAVDAVRRQVGRGITTMLPTADAIVAAQELTRRFGLPQWQFTLTATDANRHVLRYARHLTGRSQVVVIDYCYHGTVDETFAVLAPDGTTVPRRGSIGPAVDVGLTTIVVPFNDLDAMAAALDGGDVAAVLLEPAMTNIGIVLPDDGYHQALRELVSSHGALLVIDETHTLCAGPGGCTGAWGLDPDVVVVGKTIGSGVPAAAFGLRADLAERILAEIELEDVDLGGVGGTLAGNALSMAAVAATLTQVLTDDVFTRTGELAARWAGGVQQVIDASGLPWHVTRLGSRAEYAFSPTPPRTGAEAAACDDFVLQQYLHLQALTHGVLLTPFHNMALISPPTTETDVDRHTEAFAQAAAALTGR